MKKPTISVIMSVFNSEDYLKEAIESILNQTYKEFEFLIIDDASTDSSAEIIQSFKDPRIKYIKTEVNLGLTKSLNKALKLAEGEFIARMDADDVSEVNRFEVQYNFLSKNTEFVMAGSLGTLIDENDKVKGDMVVPTDPSEINGAMYFYNQFIHSSVMFNKASILDAGMYNETYKRAQDYELWLRLITKGNKITILPEKLIRYRDHPMNITTVSAGSQSEFASMAQQIFIKNMLHVDVTTRNIFNYKKVIEKHIPLSITSFVQIMISLKKMYNALKALINDQKTIAYFSNCLDIIINTQFRNEVLRKLFKSYLGIY